MRKIINIEQISIHLEAQTLTSKQLNNKVQYFELLLDLYQANFSNEDLKEIENKFNEIISKNLPIKIYEEERESLEKRVDQQRAHLDLLPKFVTKLRIVEIEGFDICPCAGTHVRNTSEITKLKNIKKETKGKDKTRIIYSLEK